MVTQITLGEIVVDVVKKDIKNIHLSVYPPVGKVRISAPLRMDNDTIRVFALSKLGWIKQQQQKLRKQERELPREYIERESHYLWGKRYLLHVVEQDAPPKITLLHHELQLQVRPASTAEKRQEILEAWYRSALAPAAALLIAKWEPILGVKVEAVVVRRMKTQWGSWQPPYPPHSPEYGVGKKAAGMSGIHRRPRTASPAGTDA